MSGMKWFIELQSWQVAENYDSVYNSRTFAGGDDWMNSLRQWACGSWMRMLSLWSLTPTQLLPFYWVRERVQLLFRIPKTNQCLNLYRVPVSRMEEISIKRLKILIWEIEIVGALEEILANILTMPQLTVQGQVLKASILIPSVSQLWTLK